MSIIAKADDLSRTFRAKIGYSPLDHISVLLLPQKMDVSDPETLMQVITLLVSINSASTEKTLFQNYREAPSKMTHSEIMACVVGTLAKLSFGEEEGLNSSEMCWSVWGGKIGMIHLLERNDNMHCISVLRGGLEVSVTVCTAGAGCEETPDPDGDLLKQILHFAEEEEQAYFPEQKKRFVRSILVDVNRRTEDEAHILRPRMMMESGQDALRCFLPYQPRYWVENPLMVSMRLMMMMEFCRRGRSAASSTVGLDVFCFPLELFVRILDETFPLTEPLTPTLKFLRGHGFLREDDVEAPKFYVDEDYDDTFMD